MIIASVLLAIVVASVFYIVIEADHDCHHEDCHVCECIMLCSRIVKAVGTAAALAAFSSAACLLFHATLQQTSRGSVFLSLISLKVRMND